MATRTPRNDHELVSVLGHAQTDDGSDECWPPAKQGGRQLRSGPRVTCYLAYCLFCLLLTSALLAAAAWEAVAPTEVTSWPRLKPWEEAAEILVGAALCAETFILVRGQGVGQVLRNPWHLLDATVAGLTLFCGVFFLSARLSDATARHAFVEDIDVPVLAVRFALQPLRLLSTTLMVVRASQLHLGVAAVQAQLPKPSDPCRPCEGLAHPVLTPDVAVALRESLPCYLQHREWDLLYSPSVHGVSLSTFYRQQAGPNVIAIEDARGRLFGAFVSEAWRPSAGSYGSPETFVFAVRYPEESGEPGKKAAPEVEVLRAQVRPGRVVQWCDQKMFGVGRALTVHSDFLLGSTGACATFGYSLFSPAGEDFVIRGFECWSVGTEDET